MPNATTKSFLKVTPADLMRIASALCLLLAGESARATEVEVTTNNGSVLDYNTQTGSYVQLASNSIVIWGMGYSSSGNLYANDNVGAPNTGFYSISATTGQLKFIADIGGPTSGTGALTSPLGGGSLYYTDHSNDLYIVNPSTAMATPIGQLGFNVGGSWDISFAQNGNLYAAVNGNFYEIDTANGAGKLIGSTGLEVQGLIAGDGGLYGFSGESMYSIDLATGALAFVRNTPSMFGNFDSGIAVKAAPVTTPEPNTLPIIIIGLLSLGAMRRLARRAGTRGQPD